MIVAKAALSHEVSVVLQHVDVVVLNDPLHLATEGLLGSRCSNVRRLAFELFGLPVRRKVCDQPVLDLRIIDVEGAGLRA